MDKLAKRKLNEKQRMVNFMYNVMVQTLSNFVLQETVHILFHCTDIKAFGSFGIKLFR